MRPSEVIEVSSAEYLDLQRQGLVEAEEHDPAEAPTPEPEPLPTTDVPAEVSTPDTTPAAKRANRRPPAADKTEE